MPPRVALADLEQRLRTRALAYPETEEAFPWGERAIKIRGKAFLFMRLSESELSFSVKLPRSGMQALALPFVKPTEYGLGKHGWVTVRLTKTTKAIIEQCLQWVDESYRAVAPKRVVATLDASSSGPSGTRRGRPRRS